MKTGGLGDVAAALPAALRTLGFDVKVLLPAYREVVRATQPKEVARLRLLQFNWALLEAGDFLLLGCDELYSRDGGPYQDAAGRDWQDNGVRFGVLSRAAALLACAETPLAWRPQIVHCNDWPAALAPVFLRDKAERAARVLTIHNLAFQGNFEPALMTTLGLPRSLLSIDALEFHGRMSFLKGGLVFADAITTVSPNYASEIQTDAFGCGLDGLLRRRRDVLTGIRNGIDTKAWDPAADARIAARYDAASLEKKASNKLALQRRLGLPQDADVPLLGSVGRLTHQKGTDLLLEALDELVALPAQLALLGTGEREYERRLRAFAARHPQAVAATIGFDEDLAHGIEAGADIFLMPSRFEPCGLNQMYSQRYGTPPVAHATGGLADTIIDGETGFLFEAPKGLAAAARRAVNLWRDKARWRAIQQKAMACDFSWDAPARRYADLYRRLATPRR